ncbi:MAG: hypothetical protein IJ398_03540 [Clostridia bacterium]|nr:hypothetical protein [Clostridia bacterium]
MGKDPALLFYPSDFIISTIGLTLKERGEYITLLCLQHQNGHLSKREINAVSRNISKNVLAFFELDENGLYYNKGVEEEIKRRKAYSESRKKNGMKNHEKASSPKKDESKGEENKKSAYGEFKNVFLTDEEYKRLKEKYPSRYKGLIDSLSMYIEAKGDKYKSHYATILSWERKKDEEKRANMGNSSFETDDFFEAALKRSAKEIELGARKSRDAPIL